MDSRVSRLLDDLQLQLPGALLGAIQSELRNLLRDFFIDTNAWLENVTVKTKANKILYDITPSTPSTPVRLMKLTNADNLPVRYATMPEFGSLLLATAPSQPETWNATVALTVTTGEDREHNPIFPKWVLDRYYNVILEGVLARMMAQSAKPYANLQMAAYYQKRYLMGKAQVKHQSNVENTFGGQRWRFPAFA